MADDVTLEDLQKVYKRLEALESGLKEVVRVQKGQDYLVGRGWAYFDHV